MIFTSFEFILFFAVVVLVRNCLRNFSAEKWFLVAASCAFYMSWSVPCVLLVLFTSMMDYSIGRKINQTTLADARKRLLLMSLVFNLGMLAFFKYGNFFLENLSAIFNVVGWRVGSLHYDIILPPAISFFTFASMGYVLDVYYERIPVCESARDYTLFITFFPKLLSGPITRAGEFLPQLKERVRASAEDVEIGLSYFMMGAVKKLVIAEQVAPHVNLIFSAPTQYDGLTLLMGGLGYTVQIYCDFAGYSDMAIGCARMLGYRLPENFQMPYSSRNITEFWRRWHITLSKWFRDYAFLPLELATRNNPYPTLRVSINIIVMMLLVGLWHGPSWNFVIFGGIHGLALAIHKIWTVWKPLARLKDRPVYLGMWTLCSHLLTLGVVLFAFIVFRAQSFSEATDYLTRLLSWTHSGIRLNSPYLPAAIVAVLVTHLLVRKDRNLALELPQMSMARRIVGYTALLLLLVLLAATDASPFIYFKF